MGKHILWRCDGKMIVFIVFLTPKQPICFHKYRRNRVKTISTFCFSGTKEMSGQRISLFQKFIIIWKEGLIMNVPLQPEQAHCNCKAIIIQHTVPVGNTHEEILLLLWLCYNMSNFNESNSNCLPTVTLQAFFSYRVQCEPGFVKLLWAQKILKGESLQQDRSLLWHPFSHSSKCLHGVTILTMSLFLCNTFGILCKGHCFLLLLTSLDAASDSSFLFSNINPI